MTPISWSPGSGSDGRPRISTGVDGPAFLSRAPRSSTSARTRPGRAPATTVSPMASVPSCTRTVATGPRPLSSRASSTVPKAAFFGIGLDLLQVGHEQQHLEQLLEALLLLRRDVDEDGRAAPLLGHEPAVGELLAHPVGLGLGLVDLVDGDDDRHAGGLRVVHRLERLRHDAVVGGDHEDDDVRDLRAAGAHEGERLVARGVEEDDAAAADVDVVGTDVLGDPARLAGGDGGRADRVEQRRLAVVDVAHDGDHGRARLEVLRLRLDGLDLDDLVLERLDRRLVAELARDLDRELRLEALVDGRHDPARDERLHDVARLDVRHLVAQLLDRHALGEVDLARGAAVALGLLALHHDRRLRLRARRRPTDRAQARRRSAGARRQRARDRPAGTRDRRRVRRARQGAAHGVLARRVGAGRMRARGAHRRVRAHRARRRDRPQRAGGRRARRRRARGSRRGGRTRRPQRPRADRRRHRRGRSRSGSGGNGRRGRRGCRRGGGGGGAIGRTGPPSRGAVTVVRTGPAGAAGAAGAGAGVTAAGAASTRARAARSARPRRAREPRRPPRPAAPPPRRAPSPRRRPASARAPTSARGAARPAREPSAGGVVSAGFSGSGRRRPVLRNSAATRAASAARSRSARSAATFSCSSRSMRSRSVSSSSLP